MFSETVGPLLYKPAHMKNIVNAMTVIVPISNMPNSVSCVAFYWTTSLKKTRFTVKSLYIGYIYT